MASAASIRVTKSFSYRGSTKLWSNRYHFNGTTPPDSTHWTTLSDNIVGDERSPLPTTVTIVKTEGFAPGSDVPVFSKTYSSAGLLNISGVPQASGDSAILVRFATASRTSKNHPLYLFNYYHGVYTGGVTAGDTVMSGQVTAYGTYAAAWITGYSDGTITHHRCGPNGDLATGQLVSSQVHHRDFPS